MDVTDFSGSIECYVDPNALRKAKIAHIFGLSECNRVKDSSDCTDKSSIPLTLYKHNIEVKHLLIPKGIFACNMKVKTWQLITRNTTFYAITIE